MWRRDPENPVWIYLIIVSYKCKWLFWLFNNILVSLGKKWVCVHVGCLHFPGLHLKVSACDSFSPHTTCDCESAKNSFKDWTWYVWTQWTVGGGLVWFLHNHLKWLNEATQVIYSFKKYICLINTSPGTLQVSWLSLSSPLGLVVSWQQQDGSLGLTLGLTFATRLREVWTACTGRWAKHFSLTGSLTWGERCSHGALHAA